MRQVSHLLKLSLLNQLWREVAQVYLGRRLHKNIRETTCQLTFIYLDHSSNDHKMNLVHTFDARDLVENFALLTLHKGFRIAWFDHFPLQRAQISVKINHDDLIWVDL